MGKWTKPLTNRYLQSPTKAGATRIVGEDEFRIVGSVTALGENLIFAGVRINADLEILEVTWQPATGPVSQQIRVSGAAITGLWTLQGLQPWSSPGFILLAGQQVFLFQSVAVVTQFEVRWRFYYGRKI